MYAVVRTGNKQYRVEPGQEFLVEKLQTEAGQLVELTDVLLYSDGTALTVGTPVAPVSVHCTVVSDEKGDKLRTVKYRRRKNYYRQMGHRQSYTRLFVERIEARSSGNSH